MKPFFYRYISDVCVWRNKANATMCECILFLVVRIFFSFFFFFFFFSFFWGGGGGGKNRDIFMAVICDMAKGRLADVRYFLESIHD